MRRRPMLSIFYQAAGSGAGTGCAPSLVMVLWTTIVAAIATVAAASAANAGRDAFSRSGSWQKRLSSSGDLHQSQQQQQLPDDLREFHQQLPNLQVFSSQLMLRAPRGQRQYDVPQIDCSIEENPRIVFTVAEPGKL
ncbi:unnamed protein product [Acanthoscelides obtectus]|uniref:Uncharacterized protein n=1 Tax=Acanthoscelides obtectus TaxID=200917 RepID=A0A9P0KAZ1_ACAOB|nr:unnamed protein product [Acanthoscelides obtectus]